MANILLLDTSIASGNKGDDIIMECVREELQSIIQDRFVYTLPTHISAFHFYQLPAANEYSNCKWKFVGGSNLLVNDLMMRLPQWNIDILNYKVYERCVLVGVGASSSLKTNWYTRYIYRRMLNRDLYHSVRDERTKVFMENLGLKAINTGCATMWKLTPEFCKTIPTKKATSVVFTLTAGYLQDENDQVLIDVLKSKYEHIYFWVQGNLDYAYFKSLKNTDGIAIVPPTKDAYKALLQQDDLDYVGTRLHAGIYAMRHHKRAIILAIDERAREINKKNNLNCIEKSDIENLAKMIDSEFETKITMPFDEIARWKSQFT